jgi:hypothetical protein
MTQTDLLSTLAERPKSSFELCKDSWQKHRIDKCTTSKRLERLYKNGKIERYLRIERGAYIYYIPGLHPEKLLQETALNIVSKSSGTLARVLEIGCTGRILSTFELGRIANIKFFLKKEQINPKINDLVAKLKKLGFYSVKQYILHPSVLESEINGLMSRYEDSIDEEANLLAYVKRLFIAKKLADEMTLYRQPLAQFIAEHKFDLFGHGGRRNRIRIVIECNLRREITYADLEGFSQRIGGTIKRSLVRDKEVERSPIARYFIARSFSDGAISFAKRKEKRIRLLNAKTVLSGSLEEISPQGIISKQKPSYYGRFKEVKGIAFEAEIEPVYRQKGFKTERRKHFFLDGNQVTDVDTGKPITDVDLFAERKNGNNEIVLIECKSSAENLTRKMLFGKTKKYWHIADFLERKESPCQIEIVVIANVNEADKEEVIEKSSSHAFKMIFITPVQFYNEHPKALKGAPKWMFGL